MKNLIQKASLEKIGVFSFLLFFLFTPLLLKIKMAEGIYVEPLMPLLVFGLGLILSRHLGVGSLKKFWSAAKRIVFPNPLSVVYFLLIGLLLASFSYGYAVTGFFNWGDLLRIIKYGLYFLPFPLAIYAGCYLGPRGIKTVLLIFVAVGVAAAVASFIRVFSFLISGGKIDFWTYNVYNRSVGFLGQYLDPINLSIGSTGKSAGGTYGLYAAAVLAVCLALAALVRNFRSLKFRLLILSSSVLLGAILYALSRSATIVAAAVIAGWVLWLLRSRKFKVVLASLLFLFVSSSVFILINPQVSRKFLSTLKLVETTSTLESGEVIREEGLVVDSSTQGRFYRWGEVLEVFKIYPPFAIFGVGYNSQNLGYFAGIGQTHSLFLDMWIRGGIGALGLMILVWILLFRNILSFAFSRSREVRLLGLTLGGFALGWLLDNLISGEQFFSDAPMIAFWGVLGLVTALKQAENQTDRPKKVLIALTSSEVGGAPKVVFDLLKNLGREAKGKFEFVIAAPPGPFLKKFKDLGYRVFPVGLDKISLKIFKEFLKVARKEEIDLINSHGKGAGLYARKVGFLMDIPVVQTFHGLHYRYRNPLVRFSYLWAERFLTLFTRFVVSVSISQEKEGLALGVFPKSKSRLVINGIKPVNILDSRAVIRKSLGLTDKDFTVAVVARFDEVKGHLRFINLIPSLAAAVPNIKVVFAGGGDKEREAKQLVKNIGVSDSVIFLGERTDVPRILKASDALVLPSYHEGLPLAPLEAAAAGLPVVGSNVVGVKDTVLDGKTGYLVDFDNPAEVIGAFKNLAKSPALRRRMGERGRKFVEKEFSMEKFIRKTLAVYNEAISSHP